MGSKPIKDILEELDENSEKIFGDDTKLWSQTERKRRMSQYMRLLFFAYTQHSNTGYYLRPQ